MRPGCRSTPISDKVPLTLLEQLSGHWRSVYIAQKRAHDVSIRRIVWGQLLTVLTVGAASYFLQSNKAALLLGASSLILYPSLSNLFSSNAAAFSASLHYEIDTPDVQRSAIILRALSQSLSVAALASVVISLLSGLVGSLLFQAAILKTLLFGIIAGLGTGLIGLPITICILFFIRHTEANPDDVATPLANTIFSVFPLILIVAASRWLA